MGLDGLLSARRSVLARHRQRHRRHVWNPATDPQIAQTYSVKTLEKRLANKRAVEQRFKLDAGDGIAARRGQPPHLAEGHGHLRGLP